MGNAKPLLPLGIIFAPDIYSTTAGANAIILITEWQEFIQADWKDIKKQMKKPYLVFDGRNALAQDKLRALGFKYVGIGRRIG